MSRKVGDPIEPEATSNETILQRLRSKSPPASEATPVKEAPPETPVKKVKASVAKDAVKLSTSIDERLDDLLTEFLDGPQGAQYAGRGYLRAIIEDALLDRLEALGVEVEKVRRHIISNRPSRRRRRRTP